LSETIDEKSEPFDKFELFAAILLGLAAIGAAVAGYQSNLWGGKSTEAYGEAATQSTKASTQFNLSVVGVAHDLNVDMDAKTLIAEAAYSNDPVVKKRALDLASYLYTTQLDDRAYTALKLPPELREGDRAKRFEIPEETLMGLFDVDLEDDYYAAMLAEGNQAFADADKRFDEGRAANDTGDTFDLIGVIYTVSLFFAGIALVFRSSLRWIMLYLGAAVFVGATVYLFLTPWA
jgi:hypothetical protein